MGRQLARRPFVYQEKQWKNYEIIDDYVDKHVSHLGFRQ